MCIHLYLHIYTMLSQCIGTNTEAGEALVNTCVYNKKIHNIISFSG